MQLDNVPLVTVGIPCYNVERFIGMAVQSVLNQTYKNFELIITDDGSTDNTLDIIRRFKDSRIKLVADGANHGISYRLNQQIDMAKGKYFIRMDGDDIMFPNRIEEQIKFLQANPDVSIVSAQAVVIDDENKILGHRGSNTGAVRLTIDEWKEGKTLIHPTVAGRMEYFRKYHYRDAYKGVEDIDLWMRTCRNEKLMILPIPLMFYRDPLRFKLSTYLFRAGQARRLFDNAAELGVIGKREANKRKCLSLTKSGIATILTFLHLDSVMIAKRNKHVAEEGEFGRLLENVITKN